MASKTLVRGMNTTELRKFATSLASSNGRLRGQLDGAVRRGADALNNAESVAAGFALGLVEDKYGEVQVMGFDLPAVLAVGLQGANVLGLGGKRAETHLNALTAGCGAVAAYKFARSDAVSKAFSGDDDSDDFVDIDPDSYGVSADD